MPRRLPGLVRGLTGESLAAHWVYGISAANVRDVVVDGVVRVRDRRAFGDGEPSAFASAAAQDLWERMDAVPPHPFEPAGAR